ncbi:MAG TPA: DUF488 domain-containing protein [Planctomycetota bacterium]|nr:DUF488 domain-containing protein [Planctomycetota bacterium]
MDIASVGHSIRPLAEFLDLLRAHGIATLVDVRKIPGSRRHPHFAREALAEALTGAGISYRWMPELGGRRSTAGLSDANAAWRVPAFHAYADHLASADGHAALDALEAIARASPTAFMCAEALWTKCHRRLIADALTARGWNVRHLMTAKRAEPHRLPDFAQVADGAVAYPATWSA